MDKKSILLVSLGYGIWGFQPLFWALLAGVDSFMTLAGRILWGAIFTVGLLAVTKRLPKLKALFTDRKRMRYMIPATVFMFFDWGIFVYAVQTGHVLDVSLGYFMSPLLTMLLSVLMFREKIAPLQLAAIGLTATGVIVSAVQYGTVPVLSLLLLCSSFYAALKKKADVEPLVSIAAETLMMSPIALGYILLFRLGDIGSFSAAEHILIVLSGIITVVPMTLYAIGIRQFPMLFLGFFQYLSPTLTLICGLLFMNETITPSRLVTFLFIWVGVAVYLFHLIRQHRREKAAQPALESSSGA